MSMAMLQRDPQNKIALMVLAHIALLTGITGDALAIATRAQSLDSKDPRIKMLLAEIHGARAHTDKALAFCEDVLTLHPQDVSATNLKARLLERAGNWQEARDLLQPYIDSPAKTHLHTLILARCWMQEGRYDEAINLIDQTLPTIAGSAKSDIKKFASLLALKARILDRAGRYDEAWEEAKAANDLSKLDYQPAKLTQEVDALIGWFTKERIEGLARATPTDAEHVFIVGTPRSGTTLTEQILDAHPEATGLGEIKKLDIIARTLPQTLKLNARIPEIVASLTTENLDSLVGRYEQSIQQQGFAATGTYINKNLRNPFLLGLIAMMFPNARVIFSRRDIRDTGVSSFFAGMSYELFPYLFDVDHMASATRDILRLIDHWQQVLPLRFIDMHYEQLVTQQEAETRRLLEFCDLPWDERCLKFWQSDRTVMTASYDQVTRPMYDSSIGRYKNYAEHLGPLQQLVDEQS